MVKQLITDISEEDFRKLDIKVLRNEREEVDERSYTFVMREVSLNEIIDRQIRATVESGSESDLNDLNTPLTIAIHEPDGYYLDKFMNRFTGAQSYQLGWGIKHLYSTRDYYEAREDYWKVRKSETKVIYRIKLADHWLKEFVLKHKMEIIDWPFNVLPDGVSPDYIKGSLVIRNDLEEDGSWKVVGREARFKYLHMEMRLAVDENGNKLKLQLDNKEKENGK